MATLFTRPSIFDRSDNVLLFTFWDLDDLSDVIVGKENLTHLYPYSTLNRTTGFSTWMICGRLDFTKINNIRLFTNSNLTKKIHSNNATCFTTAWKNIMYVYIDHQPTVMSLYSSNNILFTLSVNMNGFTKCMGINGAKKVTCLHTWWMH